MLIRHGEDNGTEGSLFECLLAMAAAATTALIFSLSSGVRWQLALALMGAAAALAGAALFTFLEMRKLGRASLRHGASGNEHRSVESTYQITRAEQLERTTEQLADRDEGCFHHENHPESPGEDQGQLTSHLAGSTPFCEKLDQGSQIRANK
jgi:hypothetical protein